ncbi:MarR family winged helix-turn-helix transcriptional regulator [Actinoplanes sp. HUAS TT8]|uniref:MarR family winged helix-turn-helix transcriptional regulator n=1 Tax=Actinoplanes sp. HUAS TT8 TaxID=3447453 RepID=UPI003F5284B2
MTSDAVVDALVRSSFQVMGVLTRVGAGNDLSLTQLRVLGILRDRRARVTDLALFLGVDKSSMSGLIDRAERRGLIGRDKSPEDRRATDVFLTPAGLELTGRIYAEVRAALEPSTRGLDAEQQQTLAGLLEPILISSAGPGPLKPGGD